MSADGTPAPRAESSAPVTPSSGAESPAPASAQLPPEPVGSLIGEEPKGEPEGSPIIGAEPGKEPPKELPKEGQPPVEKAVAEQKPVEQPGPPKDGKYEAFKLPEGVELEPVALEAAQKFMAEELKLPQDKAQALVDFHVKALQMEALAPYQLWEDTQKKWQDEVKADKEIGGDNLPNVKVKIAKLLDQFGDPKVKEALAFTGAGNNPAIIRTFYKIAEQLVEGTFVPSGGASQTARSAEQVFYPSMFEGKK